MRLLLDTHFIIWWLGSSPKLGKKIRQMISESESAVSTASLIELRMKIVAGKFEPPAGASAGQQLAAEGFTLLSLKPEHVEESARFEQSHGDVYDCLLLGTAVVEGYTLLTRDAALLALAKKVKLAWVMEG